ncbi:hypothetical protein FDECE_14967 [Fusarium decemcellulare]|nr:hypothetical protein FDECE_14967 [Fusarium decemcellulare]
MLILHRPGDLMMIGGECSWRDLHGIVVRGWCHAEYGAKSWEICMPVLSPTLSEAPILCDPDVLQAVIGLRARKLNASTRHYTQVRTPPFGVSVLVPPPVLSIISLGLTARAIADDRTSRHRTLRTGHTGQTAIKLSNGDNTYAVRTNVRNHLARVQSLSPSSIDWTAAVWNVYFLLIIQPTEDDALNRRHARLRHMLSTRTPWCPVTQLRSRNCFGLPLADGMLRCYDWSAHTYDTDGTSFQKTRSPGPNVQPGAFEAQTLETQTQILKPLFCASVGQAPSNSDTRTAPGSAVGGASTAGSHRERPETPQFLSVGTPAVSNTPQASHVYEFRSSYQGAGPGVRVLRWAEGVTPILSQSPKPLT